MKRILSLVLFFGLSAIAADAQKDVAFYINSDPQQIFVLMLNGDIILRGKVIGHDDELGKILTETKKQRDAQAAAASKKEKK